MGITRIHARDEGNLNDLVSAEIRSLLGRYRIPQGAIADAIGVTQSAVSKRLRGVTPWSLTEVSITAELFGLTGPELIGQAAQSKVPHQMPDAGLLRAWRDSNPQPADP